MNTETQSLISAFTKAFGDQLTAVYIHDDDKLLLVPAADVDIHQMRAVFRKTGSVNTPSIVPQPVFMRCMRLFPLLAQSLQDGTCVRGKPIRLKRRINELSYWAQEAMDASAAIGNPEMTGRLQALARSVLGGDGETPALSSVEVSVSLLAAIHRRLATLMDDANVPTWKAAKPIAPALPGLIARYRFLGAMVYVFDDSLPDLLAKMDEKTLLAALEQPSDNVRLVTARQLRLALARESAAAFVLQNYAHDWGGTPLADFAPDRKYVFRDAARKTAVFRTKTFIHDYFLMSDDDDEAIHTLIHDFQNSLLNVQLEHELLYRLLNFERFLPPALPDRSAPSLERLDAIFEQLDFWSGQYVVKMAE